MTKIFRLTTKRLYLRPLNLKDAKTLAERANDKSISEFNPVIPLPYRFEDAKWFINHVRAGMHERKKIELGIFLKTTDEFIGMIGLTKIDADNKKSEVGYWLAKDFRGQGFASEALEIIVKYAFQTLKMHRVWAKVLHPNKASIALLKKSGFKKEGVQRQNVYLRGKWYDDVLFGLLKSD